MNSEEYSQSSIQALLDRLDGESFIRLAELNGSDALKEGHDYRCYCPVCRDTAKHSLLIECDTRRAYCTNLHCQASNMNQGGGNLIEMYSLLKGLSFDEAIQKLSASLAVPVVIQEQAAGAQELVEENFQFVEVGHYMPADEGESSWNPVPISFAGKEALGRGLIIPLESVEEFALRYRTDVYRSHFLYDTPDIDKIDTRAAQGSLPLLGDYYVVFNATSSAEIVHAINQAIDLVERLKENYDVPYDAISVFYTSRHIEVHADYTVFAIGPTASLPEIYRRMTCAIVGIDPLEPERNAAFSQIDLSVYTHNYLTNIAGSQVSAGRRQIYKIRMSYAAFKKMSYQRLHEFSLRRPDLPPRIRWTQVSAKAKDFFNSIHNSLLRDSRLDETDTIASLFYRVAEQEGEISTLKALAPTLLRRLFDETRHAIRTHSEHLNESCSGGFYPGNLYIAAGFPGSGVSTLCLQLMNYAAATQGTQCFFVGLQRGVEEVYKRSLSHLGKIPVSEIDAKRQDPAKLYDDKDFNRRIFNAFEQYQQFADNITVLEGAAASSLHRLGQLVRDKREDIKSRGGRSPGVLLVIDSLQLLVAMTRARYAEQRAAGELTAAELAEWDVDSLTSRLKALARALDITVLATFEHYATHRLLSGEMSEGNPALQSLLLTTQFADCVMVLTRQGANLLNLMDYFKTHLMGTPLENKVEPINQTLSELEQTYAQTREFRALRSEFAILDIVKNRNGPRDKVLFVYHKPTSHMEPLEYLPADYRT